MTTGAVPNAGVRAFRCPSCGAAIAQRGMEWTRTIVCAQCSSILDPTDPNLRVLQRFDARLRVAPAIPLGTRGQWRGAAHEVIGFQVRTITVDGVDYSWREYLLFNPYHGFRYLTEYAGHWNDVVAVHGLPVATTAKALPAVRWRGETFRHFQTADARTTYVLGEFPWEVRVGDRVEARDYVAPPRMLSAERDASEESWSLGEYVDGKEIWRAFRLPGSPPPVVGVFANQPSPHLAGSGALWRMFAGFVGVLLLLFLGRAISARDEGVYAASQLFDPRAQPEAAFVTPSFELRGGTRNVVIQATTDIENSWMALDYALIDERTGRVFEAARDVSYYHGVDGGESWREGSRVDRATIGGVPGGRYFLRVGQEGPPSGAPVHYRLTVRRDVPAFSHFVLALLALLVPPILAALRAAAFEGRRWAESDHAPVSSDDE